MKKIWLTGILNSLLEMTEPAVSGEVTQIENGKILVEETLANRRWIKIWFDTNRIGSLKVGQHVSISTNAVDVRKLLHV